MTPRDYRLIQKCGHGGFGEVWIAEDITGLRIALKIINDVQLSQRELQGLEKRKALPPSPYLLAIRHIGRMDDGRVFYTMDLADNLDSEGGYIAATLANVLLKRTFSATETITLGVQVLSGLKVLHDAHLVHRDVKPENILFVSGVLKLSDLGLLHNVTQCGTLAGTVGFIPPERLLSGGAPITPTDDLYAVGKVLYCCLHGNNIKDFPGFSLDTVSLPNFNRVNSAIKIACNHIEALRFQNVHDFVFVLKHGIGHKHIFWGMIYMLRNQSLLLCVASALCLILYLWINSPAMENSAPVVSKWRNTRESVKTLESLYIEWGEIVNRVKIGTNQYNDPVFSEGRCFPTVLNSKFAQKTLIDDSFSDRYWTTKDAEGFGRNNGVFKFYSNAKGVLELTTPLPKNYVISFEVNLSALCGEISFVVKSHQGENLSSADFCWSITGENSVLELRPLTLRKSSVRDVVAMPVSPPLFDYGMNQFMIVQTSQVFRLYINKRLVMISPSLFMGGFFEIKIQGKQGNRISMRDFSLIQIIPNADCPDEECFRLPVQYGK